MKDDEFKFLGKPMDSVSIYYGVLLVIWGAVISWISGSESFTSWIPAFIGFPIFLCGCLARLNPNRTKFFMHFSVLFGLIAFLGGIDFLRGLTSELGPFSNLYAGISKLILLFSGALFCYLCIKSFRFARRKKNEAGLN